MPFADQPGPRFENGGGSERRSSFPVELRGERIEAPFGSNVLRGNQDARTASIWMRKCRRMRDGRRA